MRTFIALGMSPGTKNSLAELIAGLKRDFGRQSWVRPESMHLTLKFLGEIDPGAVEGISVKLEKVAADARPLEYIISSLGCFPNPRRPRVIWAGMEGEIDELRALQRAVDAELEELGFERERRPFSPHITLARVKRPIAASRLEAAVERHAGKVFGEECADNILLMKSDLHPTGAVYTRLAEIPFGKRD